MKSKMNCKIFYFVLIHSFISFQYVFVTPKLEESSFKTTVHEEMVIIPHVVVFPIFQQKLKGSWPQNIKRIIANI